MNTSINSTREGGPTDGRARLWGLLGVGLSAVIWGLVTRSTWVALATLVLGATLLIILPIWLPMRSTGPARIVTGALFFGGVVALAWLVRSRLGGL